MKVRILSYTTSDGVKHPLQPPVVIEESAARTVLVRKSKKRQMEFVESCGDQYIDTGVVIGKEAHHESQL